MKSVLLLGGAGFIGSAIAKCLLGDAVAVQIVSRNNLNELERLLMQCDTVVHLASDTNPGSSANQPDYEQANLQLTHRLITALRYRSKIHLVYFSSGGAVYGEPLQLPVAESAQLSPLSNYGVAKVAQEEMCRSLAHHGHKVTILRPSNTYGPHQRLKDGFGLIRTLLEHTRNGMTLQIWGDGEIIRDYLYIDDLVNAARYLINQSENAGTYNIGSGVGYTVNQVKTLVEQITGRKIKSILGPARGIDVRALVLDTTRINQIGWRPIVTLADGIKRTWSTMST
jgi:UDP-glucose 4-epimerase